ncbi:uncharacterized protein METZ01_LOCUS498503, partial [marine metagenome]
IFLIVLKHIWMTLRKKKKQLLRLLKLRRN